MTGKRSKDPEFYVLHETLSDLYYLAEDYLQALEMDLVAQDEAGSGVSQTGDVKVNMDATKSLMGLIDDTIWPKMMRVASVASSISHRRSGDFF